MGGRRRSSRRRSSRRRSSRRRVEETESRRRSDGDGFNRRTRRRTKTHGGCHAADCLHAGRRPASGPVRGAGIASTAAIHAVLAIPAPRTGPPRFARCKQSQCRSTRSSQGNAARISESSLVAGWIRRLHPTRPREARCDHARCRDEARCLRASSFGSVSFVLNPLTPSCSVSVSVSFYLAAARRTNRSAARKYGSASADSTAANPKANSNP